MEAIKAIMAGAWKIDESATAKRRMCFVYAFVARNANKWAAEQNLELTIAIGLCVLMVSVQMTPDRVKTQRLNKVSLLAEGQTGGEIAPTMTDVDTRARARAEPPNETIEH